MAQFQIVFSPTTRVVEVQAQGAAIPQGFNKIGEFEHADVENAITDLEFDTNHVIFQHVRDALYHTSNKTGVAVPGTLLFPDNITNMAGIRISLAAGLNLPIPAETEGADD